MKAWQFEQYGRYDEVLSWVERSDPKPIDSQAVVDVAAASLNFPDLLICEGLYQHRAPLPAVPGCEAVGTVTAVGPASKFKVGDRIVGFINGGGTLAERCLFDNDTAWTVPMHLTNNEIAALSVTYGTAYFSLVHRAHIAPGEILLVTGASGGVGLAAIQLGKVFGAKVIAAGGSTLKLEMCKQQGADYVINYNEDDLTEQVRELTGGTGADVIVDTVGGDVFDKIKRCVNWDGRVVIVGFTSGRIAQIECNRVLLKNMSVTGLAWGQYLGRDPVKTEACQKHLYELLRRGAIAPVIHRTLPFSEVKEGMAMLEKREVVGKIVLEH
jgi:NADPH2:quinone reductase